jgi:hypothetical protein
MITFWELLEWVKLAVATLKNCDEKPDDDIDNSLESIWFILLEDSLSADL